MRPPAKPPIDMPEVSAAMEREWRAVDAYNRRLPYWFFGGFIIILLAVVALAVLLSESK